MGDTIKYVIIIMLMAIGIKWLEKQLRRLKRSSLPYEKKPFLLTTAEHKFYVALKSVVDEQLYICPKVGIKDFVFITKGTRDYIKYFNQISQKHIDFLLCDPASMKPICGIELDDSSHNSKKTQERDEFVEAVYKAADFPLIRFKVKSDYTYDDIYMFLKDYLGGEASYAQSS